MSERLKTAVSNAVHDAVVSDIRSPLSPLDAPVGSVDQAAARVTERVLDTPEMQHLTSTEPWYRKRSRWAAIIGLAFTVAAPLAARYGLDLTTEHQELLITLASTLGGIWASYLAYRAGTATKPLGR